MKNTVSGFQKFLASSKLQLAVLGIGLIYLQQPLFHLDPVIVTDAILKVVLAYFGIKILQPFAEYVTNQIQAKREK